MSASAPLTTSTAAASPDLTIVAAARYTVVPAKHRVHVTVDLHLVNHATDSVIHRYYVEQAPLAVLPGTSNFTVTATSSKVHPTVRASSRTSTQTLLSIGLGTQLGSGKALDLRLAFDLVDKGGSATRTVRIGSSLATFPVWAFGTAGTGGGSASVSLPAGYRMSAQGGPLHGPKTDSAGNQVWTSGSLAAPLTYAAYVVADRPGAYKETPLSLTVAGGPMAVVIRAWQDDPSFGTRVAALEKKILPALGGLIGVPAPSGATPLAVEETLDRALGGYAAEYDPSAGRIALAYDAASGAILRQSAHAWFNGELVADRWAAEGFAGYYAAAAAPSLKVSLPAMPLTKTLQASKIPLNAWVGEGRTDPKTDAYAEAASIQLATLIAKRSGLAGLSAVWKAAAAGEMADLPVHGGTSTAGSTDTPTDTPSAPDWRGLLDLLETRTGQSYTDLWRTWVVRPDEAALLDDRAKARAAYAALVTQAGDWELPPSIRVALDDWRFDDATAQIDAAGAVLTQRTALATAAGAAGLTLPGTLRTAFEGSGGTAAAGAEATSEREAIARIAADDATRADDPSPVALIGLLGTNPEASMAKARSAFAAGDLAGAAASADAAAMTWDGATDTGRLRLAVLALLLAAIGIVVFLVTRWRARRAARAVARPYMPPPPLPKKYPPPRSAAAWQPMAHRVATQHPEAASVALDRPEEMAPYGTLPGTLPGTSERERGDEGGDDR
jgi:hypothetical protein